MGRWSLGSKLALNQCGRKGPRRVHRGFGYRWVEMGLGKKDRSLQIHRGFNIRVIKL